jgi:hypothetical protein
MQKIEFFVDVAFLKESFVCFLYVQGINLGKTYLDIYGGVSVAGIQCEPYEQLYVKTKQIV